MRAREKEKKAFFSEEKTFGPAVAEFPAAYTSANKSFFLACHWSALGAVHVRVGRVSRVTEEASVWRAVLKVGGPTSSMIVSLPPTNMRLPIPPTNMRLPIPPTNMRLPIPVFENSDNARAANADVGGDQRSLDVRSPTRLFVRTEVTSRAEGSDEKRAAADHPTVNDGAATISERFARNSLENIRGLSDQLDRMQMHVKRVSPELFAPQATH